MSPNRNFALDLLNKKVVQIRDIVAGEEPFLYSSGMKGPGYCMVKGLVSQRAFLEYMIRALAKQVAAAFPDIDFVAGNATGGMIPAWILAAELSRILGREVHYVYVRGSRKKGGHKELVTGLESNAQIVPGMKCLVVEELVNRAETTLNSAEGLRELGYIVSYAACILFYAAPDIRQRLKEANVELVHLLTLPEILDEAEKAGTHPESAIDDYRESLADLPAWMVKYGFVKDEKGGTQ